MATKRRSVLGLLATAPVAAGALLSAPAAASAAVPSDLGPGGSFDRYIARRAAAGEFTGTVLLAHKGKAVLRRSHGMADVARGLPNGPDTIFALASVGKVMTAVAAVQLVQQGSLALQEKVGTYLDGLPAELADGATVHDLLTHRSGLGDYTRTEAYQQELTRWTSAAEVMSGITAIIKGMPLAYPPGSRSAYSNSGYHLLGEIIAAVSGTSYHDHVRRHVLSAARMSTSDFYTRPQWRDDDRIAHPYGNGPDGSPADLVDGKIFVGTPGYNVFASAPDLVRFSRALAGEKLLNRAYTALALSGKTASTWSDSPEVAPMPVFGGYGPMNAIVGGHRVLLHNGGAPGQWTFLEIYPDLDVVTVVLSNRDGAAVSPIVDFARRILTGSRPGH